MGRSICRITLRTTDAEGDLTVLARELARPPSTPSSRYEKPYVPFFGVHVPLPPDEHDPQTEVDVRAQRWWGVSREPSEVEFLMVSPQKVVVVVYVSNTPPVAWAAKLCTSRPDLRIKLTHSAQDGGGFYLTVTRVGLGDQVPDYSFEGVPVVQSTYSSPYEWMLDERRVDWESFFEVSTLQGHRFFSDKFKPRLVEWATETGLLKVLSLDEVVYDLRALILDRFSELEEDKANALESWPWLGKIGEVALEQLREDVEWAYWVETGGRNDMWFYPVKGPKLSGLQD